MLRVSAIVAFVTFMLGSSRLEAQCGYVQFAGCGAQHRLDASQANNDGYHTQCRTCNGGACHPVCGGGTIADDESAAAAPMTLKRNGLPEVLAAAEEGDVAALLLLGTKTTGYVFFNQERRSLQIANCNGSLVANIPIRSQMQLAMASTLPHTSTLLVFHRSSDTRFSLDRHTGVRFGP